MAESTTRQRTKFYHIFFVTIIIITFIFLGFKISRHIQQSIGLAERVKPTYDPTLSPIVSAYFENKGQVTPNWYQNGVLYRDGAKTYCESLIYGQNEQYIYAYVQCKTLAWRYFYLEIYEYDEDNRLIPDDNRPVKISREMNLLSYWEDYVRLTYVTDPNLNFIGYDEPLPGHGWFDHAEELFQMKIVAPSTDTKRQAITTIEERFHQENDSKPLPDHIDSYFGRKNPPIVYE